MEDLLEGVKKIAVVGATDNREKYGYKVYVDLKAKGYKVYGVNPRRPKIDGDETYASLKDLPEVPDLVVTVVPPHVTEEIVKQVKELGIKKIWMQPGSESEKAIEFCRRNNIKVIYNSCIMQETSTDKDSFILMRG